MNTNRNTDQLFEHMRKMPVDVPLENVEKFVIAQAALGITAVGASKGIFTKAFLKFHLNSIIIMTTSVTAALVSIFLWTSDGDKVSAQNTSNQNSKFEFSTSALIPEIEMEADSPKVVTTKEVKDGETISVTRIETETGTNIKIITIDNNEQTSVYYNTPNDSSYVYAYSGDKAIAVSVLPALPSLPALPPTFSYGLTPTVPTVAEIDVTTVQACSKSCYDSLTSLIEKSLLEDGLIFDTTDYSFKINGTSMTVNGKKQSKENWKKYKEMIEKNSAYRIHHFFIFTQNVCSGCAYIDPATPVPVMEPIEPMQPMEPFYFDYSFKSCNDSLMPKLEKILLKDGLISDTLHYTFKINGSYMKVNGEKVSKEQWKKYKEFIESNSRNKVNRSFSYAISRDGEDTSINMENFVN